MKKLFILLAMAFFLTSCATLIEPAPHADQTLEELLELAEGAGYDSTMTGAEVQAELDRCANRSTTVGDPGSDTVFTTEQAQREALNAKQGTLTNEAGLYSALSDVTDFVQPGEDTDIGTFTLTALKFTSDQATGTAPFTVASTTVVTNLNADTVDGEEATAFEDADAAITKSDESETITANWVNTANPWADNEMANDPTLDLLKLSGLTSAPGSPAACLLYRADTDTWNPGDMPGTDDVVYVYDGADYKPFWDENGAIHVSSIEMPSYTHFATGDAIYNDTTSPHVLTIEEVKGGNITNAQTGGPVDKVYTFPAAGFGFNGMAQVVAAAQMDFEPYSGEYFILNGTQMAVDEHIQNTADTKNDVIVFWSAETGDGTYEILFKSDNANWVEATP